MPDRWSLERPNPWVTKTQKTVYENPWIEISHREVRTPTGTDGIYGLVHFKNLAIGVVPLDEHLNTWLVGQYRYTLGQYSWEIPEGGCPIGSEAPLETAKRELLEETGISAQRWTQILELHTSNSVTDEYGLAFIAQELSFGAAAPEETEDLEVRKLPFQEALELVHQGVITDALSMLALMKTDYYLRARKH